MGKHRRVQSNRTAQGGHPALWVILGGVVLLALAIAVLAWNGNGQGDNATLIKQLGAPAIEVSHTEINLGDVKLGQWVQAEFKVTNVGDQPLKFSEAPYIFVKEGC